MNILSTTEVGSYHKQSLNFGVGIYCVKMAATDEVPLLKLLTIGDSGVGKSWLLLRWSGETGKLVKGATSMPTIGIDFKMKSVMIDGKRVKVQVVSSVAVE